METTSSDKPTPRLTVAPLHPLCRADAASQDGPNKRAKKGDAGAAGSAAAGGKAASEGGAAAAATSTLHVMDDELFMAAGKDAAGGSGKEAGGSGHKPGGLTSFVAGRGKVRGARREQSE